MFQLLISALLASSAVMASPAPVRSAEARRLQPFSVFPLFPLSADDKADSWTVPLVLESSEQCLKWKPENGGRVLAVSDCNYKPNKQWYIENHGMVNGERRFTVKTNDYAYCMHFEGRLMLKPCLSNNNALKKGPQVFTIRNRHLESTAGTLGRDVAMLQFPDVLSENVEARGRQVGFGSDTSGMMNLKGTNNCLMRLGQSGNSRVPRKVIAATCDVNNQDQIWYIKKMDHGFTVKSVDDYIWCLEIAPTERRGKDVLKLNNCIHHRDGTWTSDQIFYMQDGTLSYSKQGVKKYRVSQSGTVYARKEGRHDLQFLTFQDGAAARAFANNVDLTGDEAEFNSDPESPIFE